MQLLIFKRTNFEITENNKYELKIKKLSGRSKTYFIEFITELCKKSEKEKTYINVYKIGKASLHKIAFIKEGQLYTL